MDKTLRNTSILGILIISFSIFYSFAYKPYTKKNAIMQCQKETENLVEWNSAHSRYMEKFKYEYDRCLKSKGF